MSCSEQGALSDYQWCQQEEMESIINTTEPISPMASGDVAGLDYTGAEMSAAEADHASYPISSIVPTTSSTANITSLTSETSFLGADLEPETPKRGRKKTDFVEYKAKLNKKIDQCLKARGTCQSAIGKKKLSAVMQA